MYKVYLMGVFIMKKCKLCSSDIPNSMVIDGKRRNFQRRKYCLECSPFGSGNTAKLSRYGETFLDFKTKGQLKRKKEKNKKIYTKYQKEKREERKQKLVALRGGKCVKCGYNKCYACLDFHHRDPATKEFEISASGLLLKWDRLVNEANKCDVYCKNCHNELHFLLNRET